jgi:hypothetical protein
MNYVSQVFFPNAGKCLHSSSPIFIGGILLGVIDIVGVVG